ncbi:hypothetical protein Sango_2088700 [Sesamum angolense]|uniref:DUF4283 domain-containing protein n=1 Tax=Sesamum angolense TaxID=2727404 RepID=A0AAE1WBN6_9LAMI|nr:hypothetical protein Sango_2088700 [Sesamum angolense]
MMAPKEDGREVPCKVDVEYEWAPPKCATCKSLEYTIAACSTNKPVARPPMAVYVKKTRPSNEQRYMMKIPTPESREMEKGEVAVPETQGRPNPILDEPGLTRDEYTRNVQLRALKSAVLLWFFYVERGRFHSTAFMIVVYGANESGTRRDLWQSVGALVSSIVDDPWLLMGDFNTILDMSELCDQLGDIWVAMEDFRQFLTDTALINLQVQGSLFTWHNCSDGDQSLWKRLDRMLVNDKWFAH